MAEETRPTLPPGVLPNITDTDPPPLHPTTEVGNGYVRINKEMAEPHKPVASAAPAASHPAAHTTTVTVTRTTAHQEPAGKH